MAGGGDLNGDGVSDAMLGAPGFSIGQAGEGRVLVHLGNSNGRPFRLRVQRPGSTTLVQPGGVVPGAQTAFDLAVLASSPIGANRVKLEYEVKPVGIPFNGIGVIDAAFTDTGLTGVALVRSITGLTGRAPYHYRARLHFDPVRTARVRTTPWILRAATRADAEHRASDRRSTPRDCLQHAGRMWLRVLCRRGVLRERLRRRGGHGLPGLQQAAGGTLADGICSPRALAATCTDGNACTTNDTCNGVLLTCPPGPAVVCMDEACRTAGTCNPATGICDNPARPDGTVCNDNSVCTTGDMCMGGICGAVAVTCTAMSQCHDVGTCDAVSGVCSNPVKTERISLQRRQRLHPNRHLPDRHLHRRQPGRLPGSGSVPRPGHLRHGHRGLLEPEQAGSDCL